MGFRDDNEALRAKVRALQGDIEDLKEANRPPNQPADGALEPILDIPMDETELGAQVAAEEAREREELSAARQQDEDRQKRFRERPRRVLVHTAGEQLIVTIKPRFLLATGDFWVQSILILGASVPVAILLDSFRDTPSPDMSIGLALGICSVVYVAFAVWRNQPHTLRRTPEFFELRRRGRPKPVLLGRTPKLRVSLYDPDETGLGCVKMSDGANQFELGELTPSDLDRLREALLERHTHSEEA